MVQRSSGIVGGGVEVNNVDIVEVVVQSKLESWRGCRLHLSDLELVLGMRGFCAAL